MQEFIGRKNELYRLDGLYKKKTPSVVVVKGRVESARQLAIHLKLPPFTFEDWTDAFNYFYRIIDIADFLNLK